MYSWQVFGLCRLNPTRRTSRSLWLQCHLGLSYLLTAAGQLRILTGFPFHSLHKAQSTTNEDYPILYDMEEQAQYLDTMWKSSDNRMFQTQQPEVCL